MDFEITSPQGEKFVITAPEGASQEQVLRYAQENFKTPDKAPQQPKWYEIEKQPGLPKTLGGAVKQIGNQFMQGLSNPMPGSLISTPIRALQETAGQAGADVARGLIKKDVNPIAARVGGFGTSMALDPTSYVGAGMIGKAAKTAEAVPQHLMKPGVEDFIANLKEQKAPLKQAIESQTKNVMQKVTDIVKEYGGKLNVEKKKLGIPTTNAEREASIVKYGNPHGFGTDNLNKVYKDLITVPKTPTELAQNVAKFKSIASGISDDATRVRLASVLQDNINKFVDWNKAGDTVDGVLKSQYNELKALAMPGSLKASKQKLAEVLDLTNDLQKKMEAPGQAEAFLRTIVTGKSARNKDYLNAIRHLEELSGTKLFDQIEKAVSTEKAADAAIKEFEKVKPGMNKLPENAGISVQDLLAFKLTGWASVARTIIKFKDQIKNMASSVSNKAQKVGITAAPQGFLLSDMSDINKSTLDRTLQRLKNAQRND